jgi:hypothetical protein
VIWYLSSIYKRGSREVAVCKLCAHLAGHDQQPRGLNPRVVDVRLLPLHRHYRPGLVLATGSGC